jgi:hypothetical protein
MDYLLYPFAVLVYTLAFFVIGFYVGQNLERSRAKRVKK